MHVRVNLGDSMLNSGRIIRLFAGRTRPEAASDVISGSFVGPTVPDKCVQFRDHRLNRSG